MSIAEASVLSVTSCFLAGMKPTPEGSGEAAVQLLFSFTARTLLKWSKLTVPALVYCKRGVCFFPPPCCEQAEEVFIFALSIASVDTSFLFKLCFDVVVFGVVDLIFGVGVCWPWFEQKPPRDGEQNKCILY